VGRELKDVLCRLCLSDLVYNIWKERNIIRQGNQVQTEEKNIWSLGGLSCL
jgi:hypothetical protein